MTIIPHGTRTGYTRHHCRCEPCREADREYKRDYWRIAKQYRAYTPDVPITRAAAHLKKLRADGMGYREIAKHCDGLQINTLWRICEGKVGGVRPDTERRILAVRSDPFWRDSTGTVRRLRALAALGHSQHAIADASGLTRRTIGALMAGGQERVYRPTAEAIRDAYDRLSMTLGNSSQARNRAAAKGWAPPLAWDDIDDPTATPAGVRTHDDATPTDRLDAFAELVRVGVHPEVAARRAGYAQTKNVDKVARRHGRGDVLRLIQGAAA